ncbi:MAG: AAA family ATPase, partial [Candidatus Eremiobacteraeota bacterium]|nr:AAA family ATPase [Candidatus Eremiobacteraeota bacterium]
MIILPDSYTKLRRLSAHQRHETWLCRCANGGKAVLKLSTSEESPGIRQEIAVHRKVKHPSLVGPTEEGKHFVAYPFLEGKTLAEMTVGESLGYADTVDLGLQILDVLVQVHQHGFLHKDINPSNLLFSDGRWFLLDFEIGYAQTAFLGSLPFAPPEHRGLLVREPGPWSDLYSLGKVLGFCLNPTKAVADALSLEDRHLAGTPLSLKEFLKRLTAKDAEARYRTSEGALHDLNLIRSKPHSLHVLGLKDNGARLSPQTFVGREDVLARVREAARRTAEGDFRSIWIEARPGYGKTHLLDVLTEQLAGPEVVILTARGSAERTLSPIEQWERQLSEVSSYDEPGVRPAPGAGILAHQLYFCQRLNSVDAPKVLFCDDAQWMENECRSFLSLAQERCGRLLVGVFSRPTEGTHDLMLQPLSRSKSRALLRSLTGGLPKKIEDQILEAAQGSPFLLEGYVRGLAETRQIFQSDNQWMAAEEASLSLGKKEAYTVGRRLDDLPSESKRLLLFLAVLGGTSSLAGLQEFAPDAEGIELLESRHLIT